MRRTGFTLIELLAVIVIIGVVAAIAVQRFANTKEKAYLVSMKSDLRNLLTAQDVYFTDSLRYTTVAGAGGLRFSQSTGNTVPVITLGPGGWSAWMGNANTSRTCAIFVGPAALPPATQEGVPACS